MKPKVFISYSWTSEHHQELVRSWADRLMENGVEVILDQYDLKEGHDKYAFMEKMVTDKSVTHVLVICDQKYSEKADARTAGVGAESQIISQELYNKIEQSKFVPIFFETSPTGEPYLPVFMKSRIGINFSSPELVNENWEQLIRSLFGKPRFQKPPVGNVPAFISEDTPTLSNPAISRFTTFKQAFLQERKGLDAYRRDFIDACFEYVDSLRVRTAPNPKTNFGENVLETCGKLTSARDVIIDWILLEGNADHKFVEILSATLEKLLELRSRPKEVNSWNDEWFEAHRLFAYELFLYIVAALMKLGVFETLYQVFSSSYLAPETERRDRGDAGHFIRFDKFCTGSNTLGAILAPPGQRLFSAAAELFKRQATRTDLPFESIMEAELLIFLVARLGDRLRWYPQTLFYAGYGRQFPFFIRATQHKNFKKLATVAGVQNAIEFREKIKNSLEQLKSERWVYFSRHADVSFWNAANMDKLDTIH